MAVAKYLQLNLEEPPPIGGSRNVNCFEKIELIGEGSYGQVYMAKDIRTDEIVALKKIRVDGQSIEQGFPKSAIREINVLRKLHHENIIRLKEVVTSSGREGLDKDKQETSGQEGPDKDKQEKTDKSRYKREFYLVFEYMDHDLAGLLYCPGIEFSVPQIKCYMTQLLIGLRYCHQNRVLHRDIKSANLLINNEGNLKLADFGLARSFTTNVPNATYKVVSLWYRPPELLLGATSYGTAIDMWSAGCVFAEVLYGKAILQGNTETDQLKKIYELCGTPDENNWPKVTEMPLYNERKPDVPPTKSRLREKFRDFDPHALELVERMLVLDPTKRISPSDALAAPYFWTAPLACDPKSLPFYESAHILKTTQRWKQMDDEAQAAKRTDTPVTRKFL